MLKVKSRSFQENGWIPIKNSARGEDLSPCLEVSGLTAEAKSLAVTLEDASHPFFPNYSHWLIWNIPVQSVIPEGIPHGKSVNSLDGAIQGIAYGKNRYKGPKPPFQSIHTYVFTVYALDCKLTLGPNSRKRNFLSAINGHVLQWATLSGKFQNNRREA